MPDIRRPQRVGLVARNFCLAAGKIALHIHRAGRLLDAAAWLERDRTREHDFPGRRQVKRNDRRAMARRLEQTRLYRPLLLANPPDLVHLVVGCGRETVYLEHRSPLGGIERDATTGGRRRRETGETSDARVGTETRERQIGGLRDLGLERGELVAGSINVALNFDNFRGERGDLI